MHLIALGANLPSATGAPRLTLEAALAALAARFTVSRRSAWFRTPAWPPASGPDFVNGAAMLEAPLPPDAVLAALHDVERALGRSRGRRWEPRVCDLDLLASDGAVLPDAATVRRWMALGPEAARSVPPALVLPHPRLHERAFVLAPLAEVAPDWVHPLLGRSVREMLAALPAGAAAGIERIGEEPCG
jgi:2-amino-4-hydroxy-6-hydroxymethyldihydropteridine diphosphokinase